MVKLQAALIRPPEIPQERNGPRKMKDVRLLSTYQSFEKGHALVEEICGMKRIGRDESFYLWDHGVCPEAIDWLIDLSPEERALLRIISNRTADELFAYHSDLLPALGSYIWTRTICAVADMGKPMPSWLQYADPNNETLYSLDTSNYQQKRNVGIVFDDYEIAWRNENEALYLPIGNVTVIEDFITRERGDLVVLTKHRTTDETAILGPAGEDRRILISSRARIGPITRPYHNGYIRGHMCVFDSPSEHFPLFVELPFPEYDRRISDKPPVVIDIVDDQPTEKLNVRSIAQNLRVVVGNLALQCIQNPDSVSEEEPPALKLKTEVVTALGGIRRVRESVRSGVYLAYQENQASHTVMDFANTFHYVCSALKIPREKH